MNAAVTFNGNIGSLQARFPSNSSSANPSTTSRSMNKYNTGVFPTPATATANNNINMNNASTNYIKGIEEKQKEE